MGKGNARRRVGKGLMLAACSLFAACAVNGQTPTPPPSPAAPPAGQLLVTPADATTTLPAWDVSTFKPSATDARGSMLMFTPDGIKVTNVPLRMVVREAFGLEDDRIFGGAKLGEVERLRH